MYNVKQVFRFAILGAACTFGSSTFANDSDLGEKFKPILHLSNPGVYGVDFKSFQSNSTYGVDHHYPYSDYVPIDATKVLDTDTLINQLLFEGFFSIPVFVIDVNDYLGTYTPKLPNETSLVLGDVEYREVDLEEFYPAFYMKEALQPAAYYRTFENPFWPDTPKATQYWFYYVNNDWAFDHVSDWESVTYFADNDNNAIEANYSMHYEARKYRWSEIEKTSGQPSIYIANGGHGSYAHSGTTSYLTVDDDHDGSRESFTFDKLYSLTDSSNGKRVMAVDGQWGAGKAPHGPRYRIDKKQGWLDKILSINPYQGCKASGNINIYGKLEQLPEKYTNETFIEVVNNDLTEANDLKKDLIYYGPWIWSSGYFFEGEACESIPVPESIDMLSADFEDTKIELSWEQLAGEQPQGYQIKVYETAATENQSSQIIHKAFIETCEDDSSCSLTIENPYGSVASCVEVTPWNATGDGNAASICPTPKLSIVLDDTGSMEDEIELVKRELRQEINKTPENILIQLITFKDNSTERLISSDKVEILNTLDAVYASGGGKCPENLGSALLLAAESVADSATIITVTDASNHSENTYKKARELIDLKDVKVTTLLSGTCDDATAASSKSSENSSDNDDIAIREIPSREWTVPQSQVENQAQEEQPELNEQDSFVTSKANTFDKIDWEASGEDNFVDASAFWTDSDPMIHYIGFETDHGFVDQVDNFSAVLNKGHYALRFREISGRAYALKAELFTLDSEGNYQKITTTYPTFSIESQNNATYESTDDATIYIRVTATASTIDSSTEPTAYTLEMVSIPDPSLSDYESMKEFMNDIDGEFYYVPEIKEGDTTTFEEALEDAFEEAFEARISSVFPDQISSDTLSETLTIELSNKSFDNTETLILKNGSYTVPLTLVNGTTALNSERSTFLATFSSSAPDGCYDLTISNGLSLTCAVTLGKATTPPTQSNSSTVAIPNKYWYITILLLFGLGVIGVQRQTKN